MPNWCECELTIKGPAAEVARFKASVRLSAETADEDRADTGILCSLFPIPAELRAVESGSLELGWTVKYTEQWTRIASYPWVIERNGGVVPDTRDAVFALLNADQQQAADRYQALQERYGVRNWYEWAYKHWGTKWGDCRTRLVTDDDTTRLRYDFEAPWSPPIEGLSEVARLFPALAFTLRYWEGGMGFRGRAAWQRGDLAQYESRDYRGHRGG